MLEVLVREMRFIFYRDKFWVVKQIILVFMLFVFGCGTSMDLTPEVSPSKPEEEELFPTDEGDKEPKEIQFDSVGDTNNAGITSTKRSPTPEAKTTESFNHIVSGDILLWHAYQTGSNDKKALITLLEGAEEEFPNLDVFVLQLPSSEISRIYRTEVLSGGGPDLFISTNDEIYNWSKDGFILDITQYIENEFEQIIPVGIEGMQVEGSVFGLPQSFHTVALYYKKSLVEQPPHSTDELLQLIDEGKRVVLVSSSYHLFGWANAFGGKIMNEEGKCIADRSGWVDFLQYLQNLKEAGAEFVKDVNTAENIFLEEDTAMIINGSWVMEKYDQILKGDLGVTAIPIGPLNMAAPLVTVDGFYFNPNSDNVEDSIKLAIFLTNQNSSQKFSKLAKRIPARKDVILDDPNLEVFRLTAQHGEAMPNNKEFINYWIPFDDMIHSVLEGSVSPKDGVAIACETMNSLNNK